MQTNNILSAPLIDIIFDGRNKEYGAYELRNSYEQRIKKSLLVTFCILAVSIGGAAIAGSLKKTNKKYVIQGGHTIIDIIPEEKKIEPIVPEKKVEEIPVKTEKFTDMVIVDDKDFDEPPPANADLKNAQIGTVKIDGDDFEGIVVPPQEGVQKGIIEDKPEEKNDDPLSFVQIQAQFIGDWERFLRKNLNAEVPAENGAPVGDHTIIVQFVVDKDGNVSDITPLTNIGFGMEQEAVRVIRKATKWEPAIQNGYSVKAYRKQPITFRVMEE